MHISLRGHNIRLEEMKQIRVTETQVTFIDRSFDKRRSVICQMQLYELPTRFRGEFAGILVTPETVSLFHKDKVGVSAEQLHSFASLQV